MIGYLEPRPNGRRLALGALGSALRSPAAKPGARRKILVIRPDHLGDLLFLTPSLRRLRHRLPDAEISGLIGPWGTPVLERNPNLDRLITWEFPWFDRQPRRSPLSSYGGLAQLALRLQREQFDAALLFRPDFWWGALAIRLAGIRERIGYDVPTTRSLLTRTIPIRHGLHAVDENLRLATAFAGGEGSAWLEFPITAAERARARDLLGAIRDDEPLVALQVGAGAPVKLWPAERLAAVGQQLRAVTGARIVAIGGKAEGDLVAAVAREAGPSTIALAGATSLGELAAVLERCALAIGPDSGPLHLAVAVGTPTVHLFGPADPDRFGPYGDPARHRVIRANWPCCPCNQLEFPPAELPGHRCLQEISIGQVVDVAMDVLGRSSTGAINRDG